MGFWDDVADAMPWSESEDKAKAKGADLFNPNAEEEYKAAAVPFLPGTTHSSTVGAQQQNYLGGPDQRDFMYGRDPNAADNQVNRTNQIANIGGDYGARGVVAGDVANQTGVNLLNQRTGDAAYFNGRSTGNGYAQQLAGLEATPGPSAAQAALAAGTGQAEGSALALARSGRGFGGGAASAGLAQGQIAQLGANYTNSSAQLAAQEEAARRQRAAANLSGAAGIQLNSQGQNDQAALQSLGLGQQAYTQGVDAQNRGYQTGLAGVGMGLQGQGVNNQTRDTELKGGMGAEDQMLRKWAAENDYSLGERKQDSEDRAAGIGAAGTAAGFIFSDIRAKTNVNDDPDAALDFARSLAYDKDSGIYRMPEPGGPSPRPAGFRGASAMPDYAKSELTPMQQDAAQSGQLPGAADETTRLSPEEEQGFQAWAKRQNVRDVDHPDSHYDYRGFYQENPSADIVGGRDHFPDTYKQHGHPTFSTESKYSKAFDDGGYWEGDKFQKSARPELKQPDTAALDDADARALDAVRQTGGSFYKYKDPNQPGASPGQKYGPMAQDFAKTPAGATAVVKRPDGKLGIDAGRAELLNSSAIAAQQSQLDGILAKLKSFEEQPGAEYPSH
jgi:hypothetical protein